MLCLHLLCLHLLDLHLLDLHLLSLHLLSLKLLSLKLLSLHLHMHLPEHLIGMLALQKESGDNTVETMLHAHNIKDKCNTPFGRIETRPWPSSGARRRAAEVLG